MRPKPLKTVKAGEPLSAKVWNELIEFVNRTLLLVGANSGLDVQYGKEGTTLRVKTPNNVYLCQAHGAISIRSGTTPGSGSVYIVLLDTSGNLQVDTSQTYPVLNASTTTMTSGNGINDTQYCWMQQDPAGNWWVSPLECS